MVKPRSHAQLKLMRKSGWISAKTLKATLEAVKPGVSLVELDQVAEQTILDLGGLPSFKTVPGYRWTTCLTLNQEVVHGTPREIKLNGGDILGIDLGTVYQGWHTDCAWSILVGQRPRVKGQNHNVILESTASSGSSKLDSGSQSVRNDNEGMSGITNNDIRDKLMFLQAGERAMWDGVKKAVSGNRIGDISAAIQKQVESEGYSVVRSLVGHGVGKHLHEEPEVPGNGEAGRGLELKSGMTLAIEAIYTAGGPEVILAPDGWTVSSADNSLGGLFEMSVVVGGKKAEVLTDWRAT